MRKVCETCDHFPADNHCLGCLYDDVTGGNTKWELRNDNNVIDRKVIEDIKAEIEEEKESAYADFEQYKVDYLGVDPECAEDELPGDDFRYGMERCLEIINKYCRG